MDQHAYQGDIGPLLLFDTWLVKDILNSSGYRSLDPVINMDVLFCFATL